MTTTHNHGDHKTSKIMLVRVQRDRRLNVVVAGVRRIGCRLLGVGSSGRIGLGIAPERGDTALNTSISGKSLGTGRDGGISSCRGL